MISMLNEVGNLLGAALDEYLRACSTAENSSTAVSQAFLTILDNELLRMSSYATKIAYAQASLGRTRNHASIVAPINSLPPEVSAHIFYLVLRMQGCKRKVIMKPDKNRDRDEFGHFPIYPDLLTHVCSRWRQIMITSCHFWTHIDLILRHQFSKGLLARAETHAKRTGQLSLDIHIIDAALTLTGDFNDQTFQFLSSVAIQIRSLDLIVCNSFENSHALIFESCFSNAVPGTLTQLSLLEEISSRRSRPFLEAAENPSGADSLLLHLSQQLLEDLWQPVTVLRLYGLQPHWSNRAYCGLIELIITPWDGVPSPITKSQLVGILASSPELRVLHLDIQLTESPWENAWAARVHLEKLKVLNIIQMYKSNLDILLQLLVTGSEPLQLAIGLDNGSPDILFQAETREFFARSNITDLYVAGNNARLGLADLLSQFPHLRALAVAHLYHKEGIAPMSNPNGGSGDNTSLAAGSQLNYLHILWSDISFEDLRHALERHSVHTLTFLDCTVYHNEEVVPEGQLREDLSQICPVVGLLTQDGGHPAENWELFEHCAPVFGD